MAVPPGWTVEVATSRVSAGVADGSFGHGAGQVSAVPHIGVAAAEIGPGGESLVMLKHKDDVKLDRSEPEAALNGGGRLHALASHPALGDRSSPHRWSHMGRAGQVTERDRVGTWVRRSRRPRR